MRHEQRRARFQRQQTDKAHAVSRNQRCRDGNGERGGLATLLVVIENDVYRTLFPAMSSWLTDCCSVDTSLSSCNTHRQNISEPWGISLVFYLKLSDLFLHHVELLQAQVGDCCARGVALHVLPSLRRVRLVVFKLLTQRRRGAWTHGGGVALWIGEPCENKITKVYHFKQTSSKKVRR